ncbi:hypothetical protein [Effusibacillus lacus]|uniref:Uncharacterized protein n=1 Tax=Effusibacillus lacus TaxID=1348429 RepID=A0A292YKN7_9BACL|nr:hypothetical protein [Effusibacillus lacus]TCS75092.1 hypothetical protein EDD64_10917 [Effusibacillus lacus]GAX89045.1 hypothetical protein EFBL_0659 [Effusibacillus lacus]
MTVLGFLLVAATVAVALAIGWKANERVRSFDESKHENFLHSRGKD